MHLMKEHGEDRRSAAARDETGIPAETRRRFEAATGYSYEDVRVHYHAPEPALIGARAFTQGSQVYIGPGQESSLPHELAHVFQQKEGRVPVDGVCPALGDSPCSDNDALEREAEAFSQAVMAGEEGPRPTALRESTPPAGPIQRKPLLFWNGQWYQLNDDPENHNFTPVSPPPGGKTPKKGTHITPRPGCTSPPVSTLST